MKVVVAPQEFKGSLSASQAEEAMLRAPELLAQTTERAVRGWLRVRASRGA
jgi:glycerate kinase